MRIAHLIFMFYVAALSVYPCYDDDCCSHDEIACAAEHDQADDENEAGCTPFCASQCCTFHISLPIVKSSIRSVPSGHDLNDIYQIAATPAVALPIWQPPKL